jgi:hypothetical protein
MGETNVMLSNRESRKRAFWSAFWCGMSAPGMLFAADHVKITRVSAPASSARDSMRGDWVRLGNDFRSVITREKTTAGR